MTVPTKQMELWLAGWRKTHNGGASVTFTVNDEDLEYFESATIRKGKVAGQRYMAVLVQLQEDETPDPCSLDPVPAKVPHFPAGMCGIAVKLCKEARFQRWLEDNFPDASRQFVVGNKEHKARDVICHVCGVTSRKELDTDDAAAEFFRERIYQPYITERVGAA